MMLSRVAETLYWMSRYLERAEHTARLVEQYAQIAMDADADGAEEHWRSLCTCVRAGPCDDMTPDAVMQWLAYDTSNPVSVAGCIESARENARHAREQLSSEMFEQINRLYLTVRSAGANRAGNTEPYELLRSVQEGSQTFQGITDATMNHGEDWCFIQLGRNIERASCTAHLLDMHLGQGPSVAEATFEAREYLLWVMLLRSCLGFEPYTKAYGPEFKPTQIVEFLLLARTFPRSIHYCAEHISHALARVEGASGSFSGQELDRLAGRLVASLRYGQIGDIIGHGLHDFLSDVQTQCNHIHDTLYKVYISYPVENVAS